jgi:hypothetical protein
MPQPPDNERCPNAERRDTDESPGKEIATHDTPTGANRKTIGGRATLAGSARRLEPTAAPIDALALIGEAADAALGYGRPIAVPSLLILVIPDVSVITATANGLAVSPDLVITRRDGRTVALFRVDVDDPIWTTAAAGGEQ